MAKRKARALPKIGCDYQRSYRGKTYTLKVIAAQSGVAYALGREHFKSPSGAAKSIVKQEVNGWAFWKIE